MEGEVSGEAGSDGEDGGLDDVECPVVGDEDGDGEGDDEEDGDDREDGEDDVQGGRQNHQECYCHCDACVWREWRDKTIA